MGNKTKTEVLIDAGSVQPLAVTYRPVADLKPYPRNARTHSKKQVKQIAESIRTFGFNAPILIDKDDMIMSGHGRLAAAKLLGMAEVPCVRLEHMSPAQKRAFILAENRICASAGWDEDILAVELKELVALDAGFDIEVTGFSIAEVDGLVDGLAVEDAGNPKDEALPPLGTGAPITQPGDVWQLGRHRLICGDALDPAVVATLMAGESAQMAFSDPPFNVPIDGHVSGLGKVKHREFAMASGEMSKAEFTAYRRARNRDCTRRFRSA